MGNSMIEIKSIDKFNEIIERHNAKKVTRCSANGIYYYYSSEKLVCANISGSLMVSY